MLTTLALGLLTSIVAEVITWVNKKLSGTVLKGDAAWLLAAVVAIAFATVKFFTTGGVLSWSLFGTDVATIWAASQVFFLFIIQTLGLDVTSAPTPAA